MNNKLDFAIARDRHWYRIPARAVHGRLSASWPPRWLAFYQTKVFGPEGYAVNYYARVNSMRLARRCDLFPEEPRDGLSEKEYLQLLLAPLRRLPQPIFSRRWRRIVFIPTTLAKLFSATEINDLYLGSSLEDQLWAELKRWEIRAEREYWVNARGRNYALDFALFCDRRNIDIETDGDHWHADPERIPLDNQRDNDLTSAGWSVLRFNDKQIGGGMSDHCMPIIVDTINRFGGLLTTQMMPRHFDGSAPNAPYQPALFEESPEYDID
jgi:very-short-patch-repair endonuclease